MPMNHRLLVPRASGFNPRSIAGLAAWFDAADAGSVTIDTGVSVWADRSGNGRNAVQAIGNNQPAYTLAGRNGRNILTFDGTNDTLATASFTLNQPSTVFAAARAAANSSQIFDGFGSTRASINRRGAGQWTAFGGAELIGSAADSNWSVLSANLNGASSVLRVNGSQQASGNAGTQNLTAGLSIGTYNGLNTPLNGNIGEILLYSGTLTAAQISLVERYLAIKWGITIA
jgi:hypothetical protein